ncbi:GGDEF domain-containing protein [Pelomonas sp. SE-A7]|uniref:GGDEF domain-containing protein n=1 Tax=Pelomonas sp. SE-A7 TaxID=3054953 RepID=UPI00259C97A7|nr:GGDEF domain-containing protein [Pelomonas sp. SE-A7]MDM4765136.1 GGDEF domain-containing protein [Pelomonas sp. SE-A7]
MSTPAIPEAPHWLQQLADLRRQRGSSLVWAGLFAATWLPCVALAQLIGWILAVPATSSLLVGATGAAICAGLASGLLVALIEPLEQALQLLGREGTVDPATGLCDRRHFIPAAERELAAARRYQRPCALVLLQVDHFSQVQSRFGMRCGELLLAALAESAQAQLRQPDLLARFDDDRFIVLLPDTDPLGALDVAERLRERTEKLGFQWQVQTLQVSASLGVAALQEEHGSLQALVQATENALREAHAAGRNCVRADARLLQRRTPVIRG